MQRAGCSGQVVLQVLGWEGVLLLTTLFVWTNNGGSRGCSGQVIRLVLFPSLKVMSRESKYKAWLPGKTVHLFHECVYCPKHTRKYFWKISFSPSWLSTFLPSQRPLTEVHILSIQSMTACFNLSPWFLMLPALKVFSSHGLYLAKLIWTASQS